MISKRTQILELLPKHSIGEIKKLAKCSGDYIRYICHEEGITWIKDDPKIIEKKILEQKHLTSRKEIASIVGCSPSYVTRVFATHGIKNELANRDTKKLVSEMTGKYSVSEIAEKLEIKQETVRFYQRSLGLPSEQLTKTKALVESITKLGKNHTVAEIAEKLNQTICNIRRLVFKNNIPYKRVKREKNNAEGTGFKSIASRILELAPTHNLEQIVSITDAHRKYVMVVLNKAGYNTERKLKVIEVKPRNVAKTSKTIASKIKVSQSDMQKGNAKLTSKEKVMPTLVRDESKVRTVVLDSKTTKLLYPGQAGYDTPIEVLRSEWARAQEEVLKMLKGA